MGLIFFFFFLQEYEDVFPDEVPPKLPPIWNSNLGINSSQEGGNDEDIIVYIKTTKCKGAIIRSRGKILQTIVMGIW